MIESRRGTWMFSQRVFGVRVALLTLETIDGCYKAAHSDHYW